MGHVTFVVVKAPTKQRTQPRTRTMHASAWSTIALAGAIVACSAGGEGDAVGSSTSASAGGTASAGGAGGASTTTAVAGTGGGASTASAGGSQGSSCAPIDGVVVAVDELFLGERTFQGVKTAAAWGEFGFDVDGVTTTNDFSAHCLPYTGGTTAAFSDGKLGRDNSFGKNVRPLLESLVPSLDAQANESIASGAFTMVLRFDGLGAEADKAKLVTKVYGGAPLGSIPFWNGMDCWPIAYEDLEDPKDNGSAKTVFANATLTKNVWESNGTATVTLPLNILGQSLPIIVYGARMQVELNASHQGGAFGQLGGYVKTEEFVEAVRDTAGAIDPSYCALLTSLVEDLRQTSDILDDGTQDPAKTCNAISIGIGFTVLEVDFGAVASPIGIPANPCP